VKIRFRQTTPSSHPEFPFQAGQVIDVPRLTPAIRQWLRDAFAEVVPEIPDAAVAVDDAERATVPPAKRQPLPARIA
jgi:hypothetical protein